MFRQAQGKETKHIFVSYRSSQKDLAIRISNAAESVGWVADTIEEYLNCPYPSGSAEESKWLTDEFAKRIVPGCTFIIMVSQDANQSRWVLWEAFEAFSKSYRVIVCWLSGSDPLKIVFPLERWVYRVIDSPQSFIVDARKDSELAVTAVKSILSPSRRYRVVFRLQQVVTLLVCSAMVLLPLTVLLATSILSNETAAWIRSLLLRPWVCLVSLWLATVFIGAFYPSYGGPSRLAPGPMDSRIRLITPGFTGVKWSNIIAPACFFLVCAFNGVGLFSLRSMAGIGLRVYLEAGALALLLVYGYERIRLNIYSVHLGKIYRKLNRYYGLKPDDSGEV